MRKRTVALAAGGALAAAVALSGGALASNGAGDDADENVTGAQADQARAAALHVTNGGRVSQVERDDEGGSAWEVEVTKANGVTVKVRLDASYRVVATETEHETAGENGHESAGENDHESPADEAAEGGSDGD
ncbi:MAG TPA: PepSY domain-containing protein [Nocardioidaceae bacterium]|jgi:uncharacterized membrane protein YkoI|nr:PepSY domain-containing protein [Nocardioidaceae bacterium]